MEAYDVYVSVHVAAAAVWVGSAFLQALLGLRIGLAPDAERQLGFARDAEWLGMRLYLPASLVTLVFGIPLVQESGWGFSELWIVFGFAAIGLSTLIGMAVFGPGWAAAARLAAAEGAASPEVRTRVERLLAFGWVDLGLLLGAVWAIAAKPSGDDTGAVAIAIAIPVAASVLGVALRRAASLRVQPAR